MLSKEKDYMTLKADDVKRNKSGSIIRDTEIKKAVSGFAQPGPQSPSLNSNSQYVSKPNLNNDDGSGTH